MRNCREMLRPRLQGRQTMRARSGVPRIRAHFTLGRCVLAVSVLCACAGNCQQPADPLASAHALISGGKLAEAEGALHDYGKTHPESSDAQFLLGYVLFREQKAAESLAAYTAGAQVRRPNAGELKRVASDYVLLGDFGDADKWFTEVTVEMPGDADAWYLLGRTKYNENAFTDAVVSFERALKLQPKYVEAENNLGLSWQELNSTGKAIAAFHAAIDWQGDAPTDPQPFLNLGTLLVDQGDLEQAALNLVRAAALSPRNPKVHEELSRVYELQKNLPKAQDELEQAIALAPNTSGLHFKLGQIYRREGLRERAEKEFEICEKLNSTHSSGNTPNPFNPDLSTPH